MKEAEWLQNRQVRPIQGGENILRLSERDRPGEAETKRREERVRG